MEVITHKGELRKIKLVSFVAKSYVTKLQPLMNNSFVLFMNNMLSQIIFSLIPKALNGFR
jgi:hypothetical protein